MSIEDSRTNGEGRTHGHPGPHALISRLPSYASECDPFVQAARTWAARALHPRPTSYPRVFGNVIGIAISPAKY